MFAEMLVLSVKHEARECIYPTKSKRTSPSLLSDFLIPEDHERTENKKTTPIRVANGRSGSRRQETH